MRFNYRASQRSGNEFKTQLRNAFITNTIVQSFSSSFYPELDKSLKGTGLLDKRENLFINWAFGQHRITQPPLFTRKKLSCYSNVIREKRKKLLLGFANVCVRLFLTPCTVAKTRKYFSFSRQGTFIEFRRVSIRSVLINVYVKKFFHSVELSREREKSHAEKFVKWNLFNVIKEKWKENPWLHFMRFFIS